MSDRDSIEAAIVDILGGVLDKPATTLRGHPVLAAYGWNSLASLEAFARMERHLQVTLDLHQYHEARTIDDLVGLVMSATPVGGHYGQ
jgi:hypothetical protein